MPLPGPQTQAYHSKADILFYGGSAGSGKTDLILGLAHKAHRRSIIFRREYPQLKGIEDRTRELFKDLGTYNQTQRFWSLKDGRQIEFGSVQYLGDESKYQGRPHDLKCFDEITHFLFQQFIFLCGWLRSSDKNQRKRIVVAGNPPTSSDGDWVIAYWAPWLDESHPNPAKPGELRWYTNIDGIDTCVSSGEPFEHKGEIITPKSRTFIPGTVDDNPYLLESGYKAQLQALPEPLRSKLLKGNFSAGREDDPWQVIPTEWVRLAQARWLARQKPDIPMSALGVDVARGGTDKTVLSPRYANWFDKQKVFPGTVTPDGQYVSGLALSNVKDDAAINIDVIGVGASAYDFTKTKWKNTFPLNGTEKSEATDASGQLSFVNCRAEWHWKFREALDPQSGQDIALPDDTELLADLCAPRWKLTIRGIQVEEKKEIIKRIGRSPDKGDSVIYASAIKVIPQARFTII